METTILNAILCFYNDKTSKEEKDLANKILTQWQQCEKAWNGCISVLSSQGYPEIAYVFSAITIRAKVQFDLEEVPEDTYGNIKTSLLSALQTHKNHAVITTALCTALADMALHLSPIWDNPIDTLFQEFHSSDPKNLPLLLEVLTRMAEECFNEKVLCTDSTRNSFEKNLILKTPAVMEFLSQALSLLPPSNSLSSPNQQHYTPYQQLLFKKILLCYTAWLPLTEVESDDFTRHPIIAASLPFLEKETDAILIAFTDVFEILVEREGIFYKDARVQYSPGNLFLGARVYLFSILWPRVSSVLLDSLPNLVEEGAEGEEASELLAKFASRMCETIMPYLLHLLLSNQTDLLNNVCSFFFRILQHHKSHQLQNSIVVETFYFWLEFFDQYNEFEGKTSESDKYVLNIIWSVLEVLPWVTMMPNDSSFQLIQDNDSFWKIRDQCKSLIPILCHHPLLDVISIVEKFFSLSLQSHNEGLMESIFFLCTLLFPSMKPSAEGECFPPSVMRVLREASTILSSSLPTSFLNAALRTRLCELIKEGGGGFLLHKDLIPPIVQGLVNQLRLTSPSPVAPLSTLTSLSSLVTYCTPINGKFDATWVLNPAVDDYFLHPHLKVWSIRGACVRSLLALSHQCSKELLCFFQELCERQYDLTSSLGISAQGIFSESLATIVKEFQDNQHFFQGLQLICLAFFNTISKYTTGSPSAVLSPLENELDKLSEVLRCIRRDQRNHSLSLQIQQEREKGIATFVCQTLWPAMNSILINYGAHERLVERACRCLKHSLRASSPALFSPILAPVTSVITQGFQQHFHPTYLYVAEWLIVDYARQNETSELVWELLAHLSKSAIEKFRGEWERRGRADGAFLNEKLETLGEDFFGLWDRCLYLFPAIGVLDPTLLEQVVDLGLLFVNSPKRELVEPIWSLWSRLVEHSRWKAGEKEEVPDFVWRQLLKERGEKGERRCDVGEKEEDREKITTFIRSRAQTISIAFLEKILIASLHVLMTVPSGHILERIAALYEGARKNCLPQMRALLPSVMDLLSVKIVSQKEKNEKIEQFLLYQLHPYQFLSYIKNRILQYSRRNTNN